MKSANMKYLVVAISVLTVLVNSNTVAVKDVVDLKTNPAYRFLNQTDLQLANEIREAESQDTIIRKTPQAKKRVKRIVDGYAASLGDIPHQAGLISDLGGDLIGQCSGSLLNSMRVLTAAHCWLWNGTLQAQRIIVVLGSVKLFSGGTRISSSKVVMHTEYNPSINLNDIAIVYLPRPVRFTKYIKPIALPSGSELQEDLVGYPYVIASGFGKTSDDDSHSDPTLHYVRLDVITNSQCNEAFNFIPRSNICTIGQKRKNICNGDSGGPLYIIKNNKRILIGVSSFGTSEGCESSEPAAYARVTSYVTFINDHMNT